MKASFCFCVIVLVVGLHALSARADLISVDFQGASAGGPHNSQSPITMSGVEPNFGLGDVWNAVNLPTLGIDAAGPIGEQSFVDSTGAATSVKLNLTGNVLGMNPSNALNGMARDYLIYGPLGGLGTSATLGFELSGLQAGQSYDLIMYAGNPNFTNHNFTATADMNGDGNLAGETPRNIPAAGFKFESIIASIDGKITVSLTDTNEGNFAGFQLVGSFVPEPASASLAWLAGAGLGCMVRRKRMFAGRG